MNEPDNASDFDASQWPSVDLAYEFVAPSYDWAQRRFESIERRIHTFLAFTATLTLGVPALMAAVAQCVNFASGWFIAGMICAAIILLLGIVAKAAINLSGIKYLSLDSIYKEWLHLPEREFKMNAIYWASQHFGANASFISKIGWLLISMLFFFSIEVALLLVWVVATLA